MIEISHLLRKAYIDALATLELETVSIPVFDENVDPNIGTAQLSNCAAFVRIHNQTVNDASPKCGTNQNTSIQLDVVTEFPINAGGFLTAELISNEILRHLFPDGGKEMSLTSPTGTNIWRGWLESGRNLPEYYNDSHVYRRILIFSNSITQ